MKHPSCSMWNQKQTRVFPPLWGDYWAVLAHSMHAPRQAGRQGGEAASILHLLSACAENLKKKKKKKKKGRGRRMYVDHMLATNDSQLGARILLLALHSVHSYSAPAARCQIICSSVCTPPRRAAQRLAWVRLPARLIPVSRRGGGGGGRLTESRWRRPQQPPDSSRASPVLYNGQ